MAEVADDLLELHRDQRLVLDDQHRGPRFAVEFADRVGQQHFDRRLVGAGDKPGLLDRKSFKRGEQQYLPAERGQLHEALMRGMDQRMLFVVAAFAIVDIGAFPDAVKIAVEVDPRAVAAVEFVRSGDDDFEGGVNEIVAMLLAARQRAGIAAQIGKMAPNFLTQSHQKTSLLRAIIRVPVRDGSPGGRGKSDRFDCNLSRTKA